MAGTPPGRRRVTRSGLRAAEAPSMLAKLHDGEGVKKTHPAGAIREGGRKRACKSKRTDLRASTRARGRGGAHLRRCVVAGSHLRRRRAGPGRPRAPQAAPASPRGGCSRSGETVTRRRQDTYTHTHTRARGQARRHQRGVRPVVSPAAPPSAFIVRASRRVTVRRDAAGSGIPASRARSSRAIDTSTSAGPPGACQVQESTHWLVAHLRHSTIT